MSLKVKSHEVNIKLPKLHGRENFRSWKNQFQRLMGSLKIKWMTEFKVKEALIVNEASNDEISERDQQLKENYVKEDVKVRLKKSQSYLKV